MEYTEIFSAVKIENFNGKIEIFNTIAQKIYCGYTLEPPRLGCSNEYPQCMFRIKNKKKYMYKLAAPSFAAHNGI